MCATKGAATPSAAATIRFGALANWLTVGLAVLALVGYGLALNAHDWSPIAARQELVAITALVLFALVVRFAPRRRDWLFGYMVVACLTGVVWVQRSDLASPLTGALLVLVGVAAYAVGLILYRADENYNWADFGVALSTGLVLALAALILNLAIENAFAGRDLAHRQTETRLAINSRSQFSFRGEVLKAVNLSGLKITSPPGEPAFDFSNADLDGADFRRANLTRALFDGADLANAQFDGAVLVGASLRSAELGGASFQSASLQGADLERSKGFKPAGANLGEDTRCPGNGEGEAWVAQPILVDDDRRYHCSAGNGRTPPPPRPDVEDLNEPAVAVVLTEGMYDAYAIGRVQVWDPDGDPVTFRLAGVRHRDGPFVLDNGPFVIDTGSGVIRVDGELFPGDYILLVALKEAAAPEEDDPVYEYFEVVVDDANHPPEGETTILVPAGADAGHRVGHAMAPAVEDPSFTLAAGDPDDLFTVDEGGAIVLNRSLAEGSVYALVIHVHTVDGGELLLADSLEILILSGLPNEPPLVRTTEIRLPPSAEPGPADRFVAAIDPDGDQSLAYVILSQPEPPLFGLDATTGELRLLAPLPPSSPRIELVVEVAEPGGGLRTEATITVVVGAPAVAEPRSWNVASGATLRVEAGEGLLRGVEGPADVEAEQPRHGTVDVAEDGAFTYVHDASSPADRDSFVYRVTTPEGDVAEAVVTLVVTRARRSADRLSAVELGQGPTR